MPMMALSIRQPYAEEILRRIKRIEYRTVPTRKIGERFYIYVPLKPASGPGIAERFARLVRGRIPSDLPAGVLVGTAVISRCVPPKRKGDHYEWALVKVKRLKRSLKPRGRPQPIWFNPFPAADADR